MNLLHVSYHRKSSSYIPIYVITWKTAHDINDIFRLKAYNWRILPPRELIQLTDDVGPGLLRTGGSLCAYRTQ